MSGAIGVALILLCAFFGFLFVISGDADSNRLYESEDEGFIKDKERFKLAIKPFIKPLSVKRKRLCATDEYGFVDTVSWENEMNVFLVKLQYESHKTVLYRGMTTNDFHSIINEMVDEYQKNSNSVPIPYSDDLSGQQYEQYCAAILNESGWVSKLTKATGDQGVDILAYNIEKNITAAIQCKKYSTPVGNDAVQQVSSGMHFWGADYAVVVTNSSYTRSAKELARVMGVLLIHHHELTDLMDIINKRVKLNS